MIKTILTLLLLVLLPVSLEAQIKLGVRDNKFVGVSYTYNHTWGAKLEESIFSENLPYQYVRGYLSYGHQWRSAGIDLSPYWGTQWNGNFQDYGILCKVEFMCSPLFVIHGILNPHKDTSWGYTTCYEIGGTFNATSNIGLCLSFRNIPEYRITNERIRAGVVFSEKRLKVTPLLSIPTNENLKNIRLLMNFEWNF